LNFDKRIILVGLSDKQLKNLPKNIIGIKRTNSIKELAEYIIIATPTDYEASPPVIGE